MRGETSCQKWKISAWPGNGHWATVGTAAWLKHSTDWVGCMNTYACTVKGRKFWQSTLRLVKEQALLLARMAGWQSFFNRMTGNFQAAQQVIDSGFALLENLPPNTGSCLLRKSVSPAAERFASFQR